MKSQGVVWNPIVLHDLSTVQRWSLNRIVGRHEERRDTWLHSHDTPDFHGHGARREWAPSERGLI